VVEHGPGKLIDFGDKSFMVFKTSNFIVRNSSKKFIEVHGKPEDFTINLLVQLIINGEKNFSWTIKLAKEIGKCLVFQEIIHMFVSLPFFNEALNHEEISRYANTIARKKSRSENDPSYTYPPWEFDMDLKELIERAKKLGVDTSYVDKIIKY
jgi:hypothetical protein